MENRIQKSVIVLILFLAIGLLGFSPCIAAEAEFIEVKPAKTAKTAKLTKTAKRSWGPEQATGAPDTHQAGDISTAWASLHPDRGEEWLRVDFDKAVAVAEIRIRETFNPGAVCRVTAIQMISKETEYPLWEGQDPTTTAPAEFSVKPKEEVTTHSIKIYLDTKRRPGWNEIDAVELIGKDGTRQWASSATASSTFAEQPKQPTPPHRRMTSPQPWTPADIQSQIVPSNTNKPASSSFSQRTFQGDTQGNSQAMPATFAGADLRKASFLSVRTWASFHMANLREAVLKESSFVGVDFRDANLERARLVSCVLPAARFMGAKCGQIHFQNCNNVCGADFSDGDLTMARFVNCRLPAAKFVGAKCIQINFQNCNDICGANFGDADLTTARFVHCSLPAARFMGAKCTGANFQNCNNLCSADFSDADLTTARFVNCILPSARFMGARCTGTNFQNCNNLCGVDFSDTDLTTARFVNCRLSSAKFTGAMCRQIIFNNCRITSLANFSDANLELSTFSNCKCSRARFTGATFRSTTFRECDLSGADLRGVMFSNCSLINPDLRGADLRGTDFGNSLTGGKFSSKTIYDGTTKFPSDFDPVAKGLTRK